MKHPCFANTNTDEQNLHHGCSIRPSKNNFVRMKNIFIFILLGYIACSCSIDQGTSTTFHVQNQSGRDLSIDFFNTEFFRLETFKDTTLYVPNNTSIKQLISGRGRNGPTSPFPFGSATDSVIIRFGGDVRIIYRQPLRFENGGSRNILSLDSYTGGRKRKGVYEFFYTITEQDYLDALGSR